jgi:hypothetical protein
VSNPMFRDPPYAHLCRVTTSMGSLCSPLQAQGSGAVLDSTCATARCQRLRLVLQQQGGKT